jgi:hypothetical protein
VVGPTKDELLAFQKEQPAPPASGLPFSTGSNQSDLATLLIGETVLITGFFYLNRHPVVLGKTLTLSHR